MAAIYVVLFLLMFVFACLLVSKTREKDSRIVLILTAVSYLFCIGGIFFPIFHFVWFLDLLALLFLTYNLKGLKPFEKIIYPLIIAVIATGIMAALLHFPFKYQIFYMRMLVLICCLFVYFAKGIKNARAPGLLWLLMSYIILEIMAKIINNWF